MCLNVSDDVFRRYYVYVNVSIFHPNLIVHNIRVNTGTIRN